MSQLYVEGTNTGTSRQSIQIDIRWQNVGLTWTIDIPEQSPLLDLASSLSLSSTIPTIFWPINHIINHVFHFLENTGFHDYRSLVMNYTVLSVDLWSLVMIYLILIGDYWSLVMIVTIYGHRSRVRDLALFVKVDEPRFMTCLMISERWNSLVVSNKCFIGRKPQKSNSKVEGKVFIGQKHQNDSNDKNEVY